MMARRPNLKHVSKPLKSRISSVKMCHVCAKGPSRGLVPLDVSCVLTQFLVVLPTFTQSLCEVRARAFKTLEIRLHVIFAFACSQTKKKEKTIDGPSRGGIAVIDWSTNHCM
jgi:hypothetical protein